MIAQRGPAARHDAVTPATAKQTAYLRSLLAQVGIVDPDHDERWPATASRILDRSDRLDIELLSRSDVSLLIEACKTFLLEDSSRIERVPAAFIDRDADPWLAPVPDNGPPQRIRFAGRVYQLVDGTPPPPTA